VHGVSPNRAVVPELDVRAKASGKAPRQPVCVRTIGDESSTNLGAERVHLTSEVPGKRSLF